MCGYGGQTFVVCGHGHRLHRQCIEGWVKSNYPAMFPCPMCRDYSMGTMAMTVAPDLVFYQLTPFSQTSAMVAMTIGSREFKQLCAEGKDPRKNRAT